MTFEPGIQQKRQGSIFSGDFLIILAIAAGFLLTGGFFTQTSSYNNLNENSEVVVVTPADTEARTSLQLNTFGIQHCTDSTAIDFLIDTSGSMQFGQKMPELKKSLTTFANNFPRTGAVALQTYSENIKERMPFRLFKDAKSKFIEEVNSMEPESATHSKDAFLAAKRNLAEGKQKFPDYKFSLVYISDGIPETAAGNLACPGGNKRPILRPASL